MPTRPYGHVAWNANLGRMQAITTTRLALVPWQDSFRDDLARLASDQRVVQFIGDGRPWDSERSRQRHRDASRTGKTTTLAGGRY